MAEDWASHAAPGALCSEAHLTIDEIIATGMNPYDWAGNAWADALSGIAASRNQVPEVHLQRLHVIDATSVRILKRLVAVHGHFLKEFGPRKAADRPPRTLTEKAYHLARLEQQSGHDMGINLTTVKKLPDQLMCRNSGTGISKLMLSVLLRSSRCGVTCSSLTPRVRAWVGCSALHASHPLKSLNTVWFCTACGAYADSFTK